MAKEEERQTFNPADAASIAKTATATGAKVAPALAKAIGSPPVEQHVRAVFDSRPINSYDFRQLVTDSTGYAAAFLSTMQMQVPPGYIAILREYMISFFTGAGVVVAAASSTTVGPCRNGIPLAWAAATLEPSMHAPGAPITCFSLADEKEFLGVMVNYSAVPAPAITSIKVELYGNLIPKREGIAMQFAVGSR